MTAQATKISSLKADIPQGDAPILVEVWRGDLVESRHRATVAILDAHGTVVRAWGNIETPIYGRSSIKPLLAIPLVESGAAEKFGLGDKEIALACASHSGEPDHVRTVTAWLDSIGLGIEDLECGAHYPIHEASAHALIKQGNTPTRVHNNCSGKHTGFLSTARHLGEETKDYIKLGHNVQQRLMGLLEQMSGCDLGSAPRGTDGCGIPVISMPLGNQALAMARMADPQHLPEKRAAACRRILRAMTTEPWFVAGTGRFCTEIMQVTGDRAALKTGAEGVYAGALPELGLGICIKVEDGASRACEVVMGQVLRHLKIIDESMAERLSSVLQPPIKNWAGTMTGAIRPAQACPF